MIESKKIPYRQRRSAFTLIEIMVAAAITVVMVGLVIQITGEVLKVWNRSVGKLSATAEARMAMELLTADLETAMFVNKDQQWLRVEWDDTDSQVGTPEVGQTVGLKLFSPAMDRPGDGLGSVCGIGYRLAKAVPYSTASAEEETYILFRSLENPRNTFDNLLGSGNPSPQISLGDDNGSLPNFWDTSAIVSPGNYLAGNIIDFKVYIIGVDRASGEEIVLNSSEGGSEIINGFAKYDSTFDGSIDQDYMYGGNGSTEVGPIFAEVSLKVISDQGLEILNLFNDPQVLGAGTGFADVDDVLRAHAEVFKRRIYFPTGPR